MAYADNKFNIAHNKKYINGLNIYGTTNTALIVVVNGECADSVGTNFIKINDPAGFLLLNFATNGANGLDTGSATADTWYAVYAISNEQGTLNACLASLSTTSPTLPSGYTIFRVIGFFQTRATNLFYAMHSYSNKNLRTLVWETNNTRLRLLNAGNSTSFSDLTSVLSNAIPSSLWPISTINMKITYTPNSAGNSFSLIGGNSGINYDNFIGGIFSGPATATAFQTQLEMPIVGSSYGVVGGGNELAYKVSNASDSLTIFCSGFTYEV